jgi:glycosyltransferase involved in cell wall biosynthesis
MKKKLVIATDNFLPRWDGIARFLSEIIPRLTEQYEITVIAPDFGTYEDPSITIVKIPLSKMLRVGDFPVPKFKRMKINRIVRRADIIFTQTIGPIGALAIQAGKRHHKPVVAFIHSIEWDLLPKAISSIFLKKYAQLFTKKIAKRLYNKCNLLIVPSNYVADTLTWNSVLTPSDIVNLGVDTEKFKPVENASVKKELRLKMEVNPDDIILGYHGRISMEKDLMTLLRAFTRLQLTHKNIKLLIVGDGLESIKKQLASRKDVLLVGAKNNPVPYLQAMDIYCLTSLTETTCLSMLEAMSCSLAVVSTEVGFIKSYVKNNVNGLFFQKQNPYHLAKQIERLLADADMRMRLGENARKTVVERFSWEKTASGIIHALESAEQKQHLESH